MSTFEKMMAQRKKNQIGASSAKKNNNGFSLNNYFTTFLPKGVNSARKTVRILEVTDGTVFDEHRAHSAKIDGEWKTLFCPNHEDGEDCPFCEIRSELMASDSEEKQKLAKDFNAKLVYVVKVIDRDDEAHGPKFWRFKHNWKKEGVYDKLFPIIENYGSARTDGKCGVTDNEIGRDLVITIERNSNDIPVVTNIMGLDSTPLSEDPAQVKAWTEDEKIWRDVYGVKPYGYLEVVAAGGTPMWDKEAKGYVDKNKVNDEESTEKELEDPASELRMAPTKPEAKTEVKTEAKAEEAPKEEADDLPF
jgi:hypothetical protein